MVLELKNVTKKLDNKDVINNVCFSIDENNIVALVGPNGAGKTTLLKLIASLLKPDKGTIKISGINIQKETKKILSQVIFLQDSSILYEELTGYEQLKFIAKVRNKSKTDIQKVIDTLQISNYVNLKVKNYSLGMKQHLLLAIAILSKPKLILFDEPLNGLDPTSVLRFRRILKQLKSYGTTILFSSHILSEIDQIADNIIFISNGSIIKEASINHDKDNDITYKIKVIDSILALKVLKNKDYVSTINAGENNYIFVSITKNSLDSILKVLNENNVSVEDISKIENNTEKIYHSVYGDTYE